MNQSLFSGTIQEKRMVTLKDVAQVANVSKSTVSAVLANRAAELGIKEETCRMVRHVAAKLRYRKNEIAAQMKSNRPNMVALFMQHSYMRDFSFQAVVGASMEAEKHGCYLKTVITGDESDFEKQLDYTIGQCPAALFHFGDPGEEAQRRLIGTAAECEIPLAFIDFQVDAPTLSVLSDDRSGMREAVRYLYRLGHRNIMHLTDPLRAQYAATRFHAFLDELRELGLPDCGMHLFLEQNEAEYREIAVRLREIFSRPDHPTAICCGNDYFALEALTVLLGMGFKVPDEVSIIGFGDLSLGRKCFPRLTTLGQSFEEIGREAVRLALTIDSPSRPTIHLQSTTLIERESTGKAPEVVSLQ